MQRSVSYQPTHGGVLYYAFPDLGSRSCSESGRDNPFRPDGDISKEADEIVQRIKSGQPLLNGGHPTSPNADSSPSPAAGSPVASSPSPIPAAEPEISKTESGNEQQQDALPSSQNGTTTTAAPPLQPKATPAAPSTVEVTHSTLPPSQPAAAPQHVVLKKKNKCGCCVLQ
ncbi:hypothetical protein FHG87_009487 [Trinorchestia longiramus]|nr:hypothetical protein FHG87_009487 [Trinorchestia longiramus]